MRIIFVNLKPISSRGGAERWIYMVSKTLKNLGYEVAVAVPDNQRREVVIEGIDHIFYKSFSYYLFEKLSILNLYPPFLNFKTDEKGDIFYVSTVHSIFLFKKIIKMKKKLIIGTHDLFIPNNNKSV